MKRTNIRLPDELYRVAKRISAELEISLDEVLRRGLEHMQRIYPPGCISTPWKSPAADALGEFLAPEERWRGMGNS